MLKVLHNNYYDISKMLLKFHKIFLFLVFNLCNFLAVLNFTFLLISAVYLRTCV